MSNIKAIIVDDQLSCMEALQNDLKSYTDIAVNGLFTEATQALSFVEKNMPDLLFLDIRMPGMNGLEFLEELTTLQGTEELCVVFFSAHDYKLEAIRNSAFDYLMKPYSIQDLDSVIRRIREKLSDRQTNLRKEVDNLFRKKDLIALCTEDGHLIVKVSDVVYFEYGGKEHRVWKVTLASHISHVLKYSTKGQEIVAVNETFVQVSQNHIININHLFSIKSQDKKRYCVFYPPFNNLDIEISSKYYSSLKQKMAFI